MVKLLQYQGPISNVEVKNFKSAISASFTLLQKKLFQHLDQGWPTFSVHAPKFFATKTFISFHCLQTCSGIFIL